MDARGGERELRAVLDRLDSTACVLTTVHEGRVGGCLVSYVLPAGLRVHRVLVLTSHENLTHELVEASGVAALNVVPAARWDWVERFGHRSGRDTDKFAGVDWEPGETGSPLLADALGWVEGRVIGTLDCGDHTARLLEPVAARVLDRETPALRWSEIARRDAAEARVEPPPG